MIGLFALSSRNDGASGSGVYFGRTQAAQRVWTWLSQVAEACGLESRVSVVQRWLSSMPEPWILILDNANDPRLDIASYFPIGS